MAHYIFVRTRSAKSQREICKDLLGVCQALVPDEVAHKCENTIVQWPGQSDAFLAIQNSCGLPGPENGTLVIGWTKGDTLPDETSDGSYALISVDGNCTRFITDQFGSRTLWYYLDEEIFVVSTSQRSIVQLKGSFQPNKAAISWFLSSGCQGPFISWDIEIQQTRPNLYYEFDSYAWRIETRPKRGMNYLVSESLTPNEFNTLFEGEVTEALEQIVGSHQCGKGLLPLSGGLDSRLLLALAQRGECGAALSLANWGVKAKEGSFSDKIAAKKVADFYRKPIYDKVIPTEVFSLDVMIKRFVEASEGRLDQFNAYADGYAMWHDFALDGYRYVMRGDIPYTEGIDTDEPSARAHVGLQIASDYNNVDALHLTEFAEIQSQFEIERRDGESLVQWRDRLYVELRIPMVVSAFSDLIGQFMENRLPMMNWSLYQKYVSLPDLAKGNKAHIEALWKLNDKSKVPSHATTSLLQPVAYFETAEGLEYLSNSLSNIDQHEFFPEVMLKQLIADIQARQPREMAGFKHGGVGATLRVWISDRFPKTLKGRIKAARRRNLSPMVLAYRVVLADKVMSMYARQSKFKSKLSNVSPSFPADVL